MIPFLAILKYDYLQRTRSYAFLITLSASLAIAYTFVPEPNANYSTIRIADYVGYYNSAWFGYVTAIMTSVFLSLIGFYLVNSGIKTDKHTKIGQIIASTQISNFKYLLYKTLSNFLVLMTIVGVVFIMSILLFILYNDGFSFELIEFLKPYLLIPIPGIFCVSVLAVLFEVLFGKYSVLQHVVFFFLFSGLMIFSPKNEMQFALDIFGNKVVIHQMEQTVRKILQVKEPTDLAIGYVLGNVTQANKFEFKGVDFSNVFILSRLLWILLGILIIVLLSFFFHRFDRETRINSKVKIIEAATTQLNKEISILNLELPQTNYSIIPIVKTELLLLIRKGSKWLWIFNLLGMFLLALLPVKISHQIVLPILWFLQVSRISEVTTKEKVNNTHYFAYASYKPIRRLLLSQILSGCILILVLALPILIRFVFLNDLSSFISILLGGLFLVFVAAISGILLKGKKLFEVLFFMTTYANINGISFVDYFGGSGHEQHYILKLTTVILVLGSLIFLARKRQLRQ